VKSYARCIPRNGEFIEMTQVNNIGYTDYPMKNFGDKPREQAPIRRVFVLMYDTDKYVKVLAQNGNEIAIVDLKAGYVYTEPKRLDDKPTLLDVSPFGVEMGMWLSLNAVSEDL